MKRLLALISAFFVTAGVANAQSGEAISGVTIDSEFIDIGGRWRGGREVSVWISIMEVNGYYAVCAATSGIRNNADRQLLQAHKIMLDGSTMLRGLRWAPNLRGVSDPEGREAACRLTSSAVRANPSFDVELQRTRF